MSTPLSNILDTPLRCTIIVNKIYISRLVSGVIASLCILGTCIDFVQSLYETFRTWSPAYDGVSIRSGYSQKYLLDDEELFKGDLQQNSGRSSSDSLSESSKADLRYMSMHNVYIDMKRKMIQFYLP